MFAFDLIVAELGVRVVGYCFFGNYEDLTDNQRKYAK